MFFILVTMFFAQVAIFFAQVAMFFARVGRFFSPGGSSLAAVTNFMRSPGSLINEVRKCVNGVKGVEVSGGGSYFEGRRRPGEVKRMEYYLLIFS
jgi:hypothetical protein